MSKRRMSGLTLKKLAGGRTEWYIDKRVRGYGRLRQSTGCSENAIEEAQRVLGTRLEEIRKARQFGERPQRRFRVAATAYLKAFAHKRSIRRDADALEKLDSYIGDEWLHLVVNASFDAYWTDHAHLSVDTINRDLGAAKRVLKYSATVLTVPGTALTWLEKIPTILLRANPKKRPPYPITWDEQRLFFSELADHLQPPALFKVNAGCRDEEVCALEWAWEQRLPELDEHGMKRSAFVIPPGVVKNELPRVVVMNDIAQSVIEARRGLHPRYVFTCRDPHGRVDRFDRLLNSGWRAARRRAAARYLKELGKEPPDGFRRLRAHDLKHTFGRRLRAAGVSFEDRQDLLGHKAARITTEYSAAEIWNLIVAANRVANVRSSPTLTMLRVVGGGAK